MKYHLYLSTKKTNQNGLTPIYAHVGAEKKERSSKVWVDANFWDRDFKRVKLEHPNAKELNEKLTNFEAILSKASTITEIDDALNPDLLIHEPDHPQPTLVECLNLLYEQIAENKSLDPSTLSSYKNRCKNIVTWLNLINKIDLKIEQFDRLYAERFYNYMIDEKGDSAAHVSNHLKFIRRAVTFANENLHTNKTNVYSFKVKKGRSEQVYLKPAQVNAIKNKVIYNPTLKKVRDLFLLQCYTGFSYVDLMRYNEAVLEQHMGLWFIRYRRKKTDNVGLLPVIAEANQILLKYNNQLPQISNQSYNRFLKELAGLCDIDVNLTTHVGRKTFGSLMLNRGASMETTTKMLGKTNVRETERIYAEIHHARIVAELPELIQPRLF